jgi:predicted ATPase
MRCPVLVGRQRQVALLQEHLAQALAGHGGLTLLRGEAGLGKSRLAASVIGSARALGMTVLSGRAVEAQQPIAHRASLVVMAEAILRLAGMLGTGRGCLIVLEDLHWADPETLAVLEYLADNLATESILVLVTLRPEPSSFPVESLVARGVADLLDLHRLSEVEVGPWCVRASATPRRRARSWTSSSRTPTDCRCW